MSSRLSSVVEIVLMEPFMSQRRLYAASSFSSSGSTVFLWCLFLIDIFLIFSMSFCVRLQFSTRNLKLSVFPKVSLFTDDRTVMQDPGFFFSRYKRMRMTTFSMASWSPKSVSSGFSLELIVMLSFLCTSRPALISMFSMRYWCW